MTQEEMQAEILKLRQENDRLKANGTTSGGLKVSEKGALSVYGMGRFPITLYKEQWRKLLARSQEIEAFIVANDSKLTTKADKA